MKNPKAPKTTFRYLFRAKMTHQIIVLTKIWTCGLWPSDREAATRVWTPSHPRREVGLLVCNIYFCLEINGSTYGSEARDFSLFIELRDDLKNKKNENSSPPPPTIKGGNLCFLVVLGLARHITNLYYFLWHDMVR